VLIAAVIAELFIIATFAANHLGYIDLAFLWLNLIGCVLTVLLAMIFQLMVGKEGETGS
jgi:hypothetical protein